MQILNEMGSPRRCYGARKLDTDGISLYSAPMAFTVSRKENRDFGGFVPEAYIYSVVIHLS